jgi:hypothetical protein
LVGLKASATCQTSAVASMIASSRKLGELWIDQACQEPELWIDQACQEPELWRRYA